MFTVGAFAIILDEQERVLLCHRTDIDCWNLPGGGVESGETPWQAVIREVQEEVGLIVKVARLLGVYSYPGGDDIIFSFLCEVEDGEAGLSEEADAWAYFCSVRPACKYTSASSHTHRRRTEGARADAHESIASSGCQ